MLLLSSADFFKIKFIKIRNTIKCFCCQLLISSKLTLKKIRNTIRVSNGLDPDQDKHSVGPDLGPNCLQRL